MLSEWFSIGLLSMQQITWERTPAALLEKVCQFWLPKVTCTLGHARICMPPPGSGHACQVQQAGKHLLHPTRGQDFEGTHD
jgi:hypothetical protein